MSTATATLVNNSSLDDVSWMRAWAVSLADYLYRHGVGIEGIELFGSLSRGKGTINSDFDVIILVDPLTADCWNADVYDAKSGDLYDESIASIRQHFALSSVDITSDDLENAIGIRPYKLDFFLFPAYWRDTLQTLQEQGHHKDPHFMQKIARDALTFVPGQGFAFPTFPGTSP